MNKPRVTIITPVYNCAKYIGETIQSVVSQDYKNIKHIVIDDASTDEPVYPKETPKRLVLRQMFNYGEQKTVNSALRLVESEYFMIVNADDPLLKYCTVSRLVDFMEANPDILCAYPDYRVIDEHGKIRTHTKIRDYDFQWMIRHNNWLPSVGSIFRSMLIKDIGYRDTSYKWLGDAEYWLRVGLAGKMAHVPIELACWRKHEDQLTNQKSRVRALEHIRVMRDMFDKPDLPDYIRCIENEAICWSYFTAAVVTDRKLDTIRYLIKGIKTYPMLVFSFNFWDYLVKRVYYLLRR